MKNSILRELFKRLASAPETVANDYLKELSGQDRTDAERLLKALNIKTDYTATDKYVYKNGQAIAVEVDHATAERQAKKLNFSDAFDDAMIVTEIKAE